MTADRPFILYTLPKSRTTQRILNGRKIEAAWKNVATFLNACTTAPAHTPSRISLFGYSAENNTDDAAMADKIINETKRIFGEGETSPISYSYDTGKPSQGTVTEWKINNEQLSIAVDYLINGQPWPKLTCGPLELVVSYNFRLLDMKEELPHQQVNSSLMIWLSRSCSCSPDFYFPFQQASIEFYDYLKRIEPVLPFHLETKYLRLGKPNKKGSDYIFTRIIKE